MRSHKPRIVRTVRRGVASYSVELGLSGYLHPAEGVVIGRCGAEKQLTALDVAALRRRFAEVAGQEPSSTIVERPDVRTSTQGLWPTWRRMGWSYQRWGPGRLDSAGSRRRLAIHLGRIAHGLDGRPGLSPDVIDPSMIEILIAGASADRAQRDALRRAFGFMTDHAVALGWRPPSRERRQPLDQGRIDPGLRI